MSVTINYPKNDDGYTLNEQTVKKYSEINVDVQQKLHKYITDYRAFMYISTNDYSAMTIGWKNTFAHNIYCFACDDYKKNAMGIRKLLLNHPPEQYNICEHIYSNQTRICFDIDFYNDDAKFIQAMNAVKEILDIIKSLVDIQVDIYGFMEYEPSKKELIENNIKGFSHIIPIENSEIGKKSVSSHLFISNVYVEVSQFKEFIDTYLKAHCYDSSVLDSSIYGNKHAFRPVYSPKVNSKGIERTIPHDIWEKILSKENLPVLFECHMARAKNDVYVDVMSYSEYDEWKNSLSHDTLMINNMKTKIEKLEVPENIQSPYTSIFQILKRNGKIFNFYDVYAETNKYECAQMLLPYASCVLTADEIQEELYALYVPSVQFDKSKEQWIAEVFDILYARIEQNIQNIKPLYSLKRYMFEYINSFKVKKSDENYNKYLEIIAYMQPIIAKIENYIARYIDINFVSREFYDVYEYPLVPMKHKVLDNCFIINNASTEKSFQIYNAYEEKTYQSLTELARTYNIKSNSDKDYIAKNLMSFPSIDKFKYLQARYILDYQTSEEDLKEYNETIKSFLSFLKQSFKYEDDYKYYVSFYAKKLITKKTVNKGIINQGTLFDTGKNALKTYFNDLMKPVINIKTADIENFNKNLNGTYLKGELLVLEELPKNIKDIQLLNNRLKMYTMTDSIMVEEKNEKPIQIENHMDFIINTNHSCQEMFKDSLDCTTLLKRFRIMTRVSLDMTNNELNRILDKIHGNKIFYSLLLADYLRNEITSTYFDEHKDEYNQIMNDYQNASTPSTEANKVELNMTEDEFIGYFNSHFIDSQKRFKLAAFRKYLIEQTAIQTANQATIKQTIINSIASIDSSYYAISSDKKHLKFKSDEAIRIIYRIWFIYSDDVEEED